MFIRLAGIKFITKYTDNNFLTRNSLLSWPYHETILDLIRNKVPSFCSISRQGLTVSWDRRQIGDDWTMGKDNPWAIETVSVSRDTTRRTRAFTTGTALFEGRRAGYVISSTRPPLFYYIYHL